MKKLFTIILSAAIITACNTPKSVTVVPAQYTDNIRYCESVVFNADTLLVANFGSDELNPLNNQGKGYILQFADTSSKVLITPDGTLSAPKGMVIKDNRLYIADVGKIAIYNLANRSLAPQVIPFPENDLYVNDLEVDPETGILYATVTNTGNIYSLDVSNPDSVSAQELDFYTNIIGANGIVIRDGAMYIASYPADGVTTPDNVIYYIEDISQPHPTAFIERPGQYDGLALSDDGNQLYFSSWINGEVGVIDLATRNVRLLPLNITPSGPARIQLKNGVLYIPDLPSSRVITHRITEGEKES